MPRNQFQSAAAIKRPVRRIGHRCAQDQESRDAVSQRDRRPGDGRFDRRRVSFSSRLENVHHRQFADYVVIVVGAEFVKPL